MTVILPHAGDNTINRGRSRFRRSSHVCPTSVLIGMLLHYGMQHDVRALFGRQPLLSLQTADDLGDDVVYLLFGGGSARGSRANRCRRDTSAVSEFAIVGNRGRRLLRDGLLRLVWIMECAKKCPSTGIIPQRPKVSFHTASVSARLHRSGGVRRSRQSRHLTCVPGPRTGHNGPRDHRDRPSAAGPEANGSNAIDGRGITSQ